VQDTLEKQVKATGGELALHLLKAEHALLLVFGLCMAPIIYRTVCCVKKNFLFLFGFVWGAKHKGAMRSFRWFLDKDCNVMRDLCFCFAMA
jgi:hypothetical protein